jgi:heme-degrading monooxygenase HmoA
MGRIASFHLVDEPAWKTPLVLARLGADRIRLPRVPGLEFWRLLGTGDGDDTGRGADLSRSALFAVWDDESDLDAFLADSALAKRWRRAEQSWHVRLRSIGGHGTWKGVDPLAGLDAGNGGGPVAIITRANVRRRSWKAFGAASEIVDTELHQAEGLIDVVGIGETPVGALATFSLWESLSAARAFAYSMPDHVEVMRRTRAEDWYAEEMFARFEPYASTGTWNGRDPLAGIAPQSPS